MAAQQQRRQRTYRLRRDIFAEYDDAELLKRFRLDRAGIVAVTDIVRDKLQSKTERNRALCPEMKVAITLRYLATGKMQQCSCDDFGTTQPTISRAISQTIDALADPEVICQFVDFPHTQREVQQKQAEFMQATQFPGVVGVIDGTHTRIVAPHVDEHVYVNRKRYHSINVQVVFDAHYKILDIVARWPGSVNDARILDESALKLMFEEQHVPAGCYLLGDRSYPCKQWLLTPYLRPQTVAQANYNRVHRKARCTVERGIGQLKKRFHVLHTEVRLSPEKTCKLINACAVLHNICKARNIPLPDDNDEDDAVEVGDADGAQLHLNPGIPAARNGHPFRDYIANLHFQ